MNDDAPEGRPLSLGVLAHTESPELVRAALGRFRRRLLVRGLILILAIAAGLVLYPRYFGVKGDLIHDIAHAPGPNNIQLINAGDYDVLLSKVGRIHADEFRPARFGMDMRVDRRDLGLNERVDVELFPQRGRGGIIEVLTGSAPPVFSGVRIWMTLAIGTRAVDIPVSIVTVGEDGVIMRRPAQTIHLDMKLLGIPDSIWR
jgi:hypothetical protein